MEKIITQYQEKLKELEDFKQRALEDTAFVLKWVCEKPLVIGNTTYSYAKDENGNLYPTYLDSVSREFEPIYDKEQTFEFGWTDFDQVARILDVIRQKLSEIGQMR